MAANPLVVMENGLAVLTAAGKMKTYYLAMQHLLHYYMQAGLKQTPEQIHKNLQNFHVFAVRELQSPTDYSAKALQIAQLVGETQPARFSAFLVKNFKRSLEKIQADFIAKNQPAADEEEEALTSLPPALLQEAITNGLPSAVLLSISLSWLQSAPALQWPPGGEEISSADQPAAEEETPDNPLPEETPVTEERASAARPVVKPQYLASTSPGENLLLALEALFMAAPALEWPLATTVTAEEEPQASEAGSDYQEAMGEEAMASEPEAMIAAEDLADSMPGKLLQNLLGPLFDSAPPLALARTNSPEATEDPLPETEPALLSLREYTQLQNKISFYSKNQDTEGYRQWYAVCQPLYKATISINSLYARELKGTTVSWEAELQRLAQNLQLDFFDLESLKADLSVYRQLLPAIQSTLREAGQYGAAGAELQKIYPAVLALFEKTVDFNSQTSELQTIVNDLAADAAREFLLTAGSSLLEEAKNLYFG